MNAFEPLTFKFASEPWEFEQIHRLNYQTFVEEIPQHQLSASRRLVDKFHTENTYLICLENQKLVGMLAARGRRPFSLDQKLANLDMYLPPGRGICEIRLLAVDRAYRGARGGQVLQGILALLWQNFVERGFDLAIISGTTRQLKLYHHLGFVPFGPLVGSGDACFQPMYLPLETFEVGARDFLRSSSARSFHAGAANFLPGPVAFHREVRRAFEQAPESHRGEAFKKDFTATRRILCELVSARNVELFMGSGTLANDVVAAQLSLLDGRGLVLSNGEFGERLIDHAHRADLDFETLRFDWGEPPDLPVVEKAAAGKDWLWCVHCETSTGSLANLEALKRICVPNRTRLCLDCISTIGTMPVDLSGVFLASCVSGKGLRSYPGISMVFYNHDLAPSGHKLPRYLCMNYYREQNGIPFTFSSNLLQALLAAVRRVDWEKRFAKTVELSNWMRAQLVEAGFSLIGNGTEVSPAVITIKLPPGQSSVKTAEALREAGFLLSYNSDYLLQRNWLQVCLMGESSPEKVVSLASVLKRFCFTRKSEMPRPQPALEAK